MGLVYRAKVDVVLTYKLDRLARSLSQRAYIILKSNRRSPGSAGEAPRV